MSKLTAKDFAIFLNNNGLLDEYAKALKHNYGPGYSIQDNWNNTENKSQIIDSSIVWETTPTGMGWEDYHMKWALLVVNNVKPQRERCVSIW